jgi:hypothetical protein
VSAAADENVAGVVMPDAASRRRGLQLAPLLPAVPGVIAAVAPSWSPLWALIAATLLLVAVAWMVALVYGGRSDSPKWRGAFGLYVFDLLAFFALVLVWRGAHAPLWLDALLGASLVLVAALAHRHREAILQDLYAPRRGVGLFFAGLGALGGGAAGAIAYGTSQAFPPVVLLCGLFVVALLIVVAIHATWARVENPAWEPRARRRTTRASL